MSVFQDEHTHKDRMQRWVFASYSVGKQDVRLFHLIPIIHSLGRLDCQLIESAHNALSPDPNDISLFSDHFTLSYLWVLGTYEWIRTMHQSVKEFPQFGAEQKARSQETELFFRRIRVPLAKFEGAKRYKETDGPIAYPATHSKDGAAWLLNSDTCITRLALSDRALALLEYLRSTTIPAAGGTRYQKIHAAMPISLSARQKRRPPPLQ